MDDTRDEVDEILAGMTGGGTGTAGGVSSPGPPAADWARGLDAASASAARLTVLLSDVYRAHQGKDPSARLAAQIEQTVRNLTGEPPQEPEYGPGLWTAMPQRSWFSLPPIISEPPTRRCISRWCRTPIPANSHRKRT